MAVLSNDFQKGLAAGLSMQGIKMSEGSGTADYNELENKPSINGIELVGNLTSEDLHIKTTIDIDAELSTTSANPVQNKVITNKINDIKDTIDNLDSGVGKFFNEDKNAEIFNDYREVVREEGQISAGNIASAPYSHAEGAVSSAYGMASHAEGWQTKAIGYYSHAEGNNTSAMNQSSHAEGSGTSAIGTDSHAEGIGTTATGNYSHTEGSGTEANILYCHAEGLSCISGIRSGTSGYNYRLEGPFYSRFMSDVSINKAYYNATGNNGASHAEGYETTARDASHSEGEYTVAVGTASHAEGHTTAAIGTHSHSEGNGTYAAGNQAHAEGNGTKASGNYSHTEGDCSKTYSNASHAEGENTETFGFASHAEGNTTKTFGSDSHAEGTGTWTFGYSAHSAGYYTRAIEDYSAANGYYVNSAGKYSASFGKYNDYQYYDKSKFVPASSIYLGLTYFTKDANDNYFPIVIKPHYSSDGVAYEPIGVQQGIYYYNGDQEAGYAITVGNGTDDMNRSNALTLDWSGNLRVSGSVKDGQGNTLGDVGKIDGEDNSEIFNSYEGDGKNIARHGYSHAEGWSTSALEMSAHAEGVSSVAADNNTHAQNLGTVAFGESSTAIGKYNDVGFQLTEDEFTETDKHYFIIQDGNFVFADLRDDSPIPAGTYYEPTKKYAFTVGNGGDELDDNGAYVRSNALSLDWSGNLKVSGTITDGNGNVLGPGGSGGGIVLDTHISDESTDAQAASAKAVYTYVNEQLGSINSILDQINGEVI